MALQLRDPGRAAALETKPGVAAPASVLVAVALGVPLILVARRATHSDVFRRRAIARDSIEPPRA